MINRATTKCNQTEFAFSSCQKRKVQACFDGGEISSDGGLLLLREVDRKLNVLSRASQLIDDPRQAGKVHHELKSLLKQRVMAIAQGYEDLNDHDLLRNDSLLQLAAEKLSPLASPPTLCRMEGWANKHSAMRINHLLVDLFIESFDSPQKNLFLILTLLTILHTGSRKVSFFMATTVITVFFRCMFSVDHNHFLRGYALPILMVPGDLGLF